MGARVSSPTFVGRQPELDRAIAAFTAARAGQSRLILVAGEAGVGKTRFVAEIAGRAGAAGATVLEGGCVQVGTEGLPYGPFIGAFRNLTMGLSAHDVDALAGSGRSELSRLMPQLIVPGDIAAPIQRPDDSGQGRLFEQVLLLLGRLTRREPLVLILEDLHWADRSSIDLLGFLVRNLGRAPTLIAATYRSDELDLGHPLLPFLAEQERSGRSERIQLNRFDRAELVAQLRGITGAQPDAELVNLILARSDGNAFFAEELLSAGGTRSRVPDTLREVLLARVASLSEPSRDLVRLAAAGGTQVSPRLLAAVSGQDERELEASLREAVESYVIVPLDGESGDRYQFRHALVQEAVYSELLPTERTRLHAGFARALAGPGDGRDASQSAELAYHWQAAQDLPRAFDSWITAGIAAEAIYAFAKAQADFEHALALWDQVPDAASRAPFDRVDLLMRAAFLAEGSDPSRSVAHIRIAIGLVDPVADPTRAGLLHERLGLYAYPVPGEAITLQAYQEAVRLVPAQPPSAARSLVLSALGRYYSEQERLDEAVELCQEALAVARAAGTPEVETRALVPLGRALVLLGDVETGLATIQRAKNIARELGNVHEVAGAGVWLTSSLVEVARYVEAVSAGLEAEAYALRHGVGARWGSLAMLWTALALQCLGRWDEAEGTLGRVQQFEIPSVPRVELERRHMFVEVARGDFDAADRRTAEERRLTETHPWDFPDLTYSELALWQGNPLVARAAIHITSRSESRVRVVGAMCWLGIRAEADIATRARARGETGTPESRALAVKLLSRMRALFADLDGRRRDYIPQGAAWLAMCEGEFSRLEGSSDPDRWASAAAGWQALDVPYRQGYALMREAEATLEQHHDRSRALRALDSAAAIAAGLRAVPLLQAVESLARRAGAKNAALEPASAAASTSPEPSGPRRRGRYDLTSREHDVLELLVAGLSDGQIAERLFISKKTASVHVSAIKGKLGASSRVEIVTDALALGLVEGRPSPR